MSAEIEAKYATGEQKEELLQLLKSPLLTAKESDNIRTNLNNLTQEHAAYHLYKLKEVIGLREDRERRMAASKSIVVPEFNGVGIA